MTAIDEVCQQLREVSVPKLIMECLSGQAVAAAEERSSIRQVRIEQVLLPLGEQAHFPRIVPNESHAFRRYALQ